MKTKLLLFFLVATSFANAQITAGLLHEFKFNGNYFNETSTIQFNVVPGVALTADRNGVPSSAVGIAGTSINAAISNIPIGAAARTVSMWYKVNTTNANQIVFLYGANTTNQRFGMYLGANNNPVFNSFGTDVASAGTYANNTWQHLVITYNGSTVVTYLNGVVIINSPFTLNTGYSNFNLGSSANTTTTIDDLQIFNRAITPSEVQILFNGTLPPAIAEYSFNNTLNNFNGNNPFSNNTNNTFVADRNGNPNSALSITDGISATIPNLPYGNLIPASISIWIKMAEDGASGGRFYAYGSAFGASSQGIITTSSITAIGPGGNHSFNTSNSQTSWIHIVFAYNGTTSRIYKNGVLISSLDRNWNVVNNNDIFSIGLNPDVAGSNFFRGSVDDLKIYNYALSQTEITNLYNNNSLSSQNFNQNNLEVSLYPNPANDVLNIDMINEVKSIEIYTIQGQKVLSSNQKQISVSDLSSGIYVLKIQDSENAVATKKFVKQ